MTTAQVVETSVTVQKKIPTPDYAHPDDQAPPPWNEAHDETFHTKHKTKNPNAHAPVLIPVMKSLLLWFHIPVDHHILLWVKAFHPVSPYFNS